MSTRLFRALVQFANKRVQSYINTNSVYHISNLFKVIQNYLHKNWEIDKKELKQRDLFTTLAKFVVILNRKSMHIRHISATYLRHLKKSKVMLMISFKESVAAGVIKIKLSNNDNRINWIIKLNNQHIGDIFSF